MAPHLKSFLEHFKANRVIIGDQDSHPTPPTKTRNRPSTKGEKRQIDACFLSAGALKTLSNKMFRYGGNNRNNLGQLWTCLILTGLCAQAAEINSGFLRFAGAAVARGLPGGTVGVYYWSCEGRGQHVPHGRTWKAAEETGYDDGKWIVSLSVTGVFLLVSFVAAQDKPVATSEPFCEGLHSSPRGTP